MFYTLDFANSRMQGLHPYSVWHKGKLDETTVFILTKQAIFENQTEGVEVVAFGTGVKSNS